MRREIERVIGDKAWYGSDQEVVDRAEAAKKRWQADKSSVLKLYGCTYWFLVARRYNLGYRAGDEAAELVAAWKGIKYEPSYEVDRVRFWFMAARNQPGKTLMPMGDRLLRVDEDDWDIFAAIDQVSFWHGASREKREWIVELLLRGKKEGPKWPRWDGDISSAYFSLFATTQDLQYVRKAIDYWKAYMVVFKEGSELRLGAQKHLRHLEGVLRNPPKLDRASRRL